MIDWQNFSAAASAAMAQISDSLEVPPSITAGGAIPQITDSASAFSSVSSILTEPVTVYEAPDVWATTKAEQLEQYFSAIKASSDAWTELAQAWSVPVTVTVANDFSDYLSLAASVQTNALRHFFQVWEPHAIDERRRVKLTAEALLWYQVEVARTPPERRTAVRALALATLRAIYQKRRVHSLFTAVGRTLDLRHAVCAGKVVQLPAWFGQTIKALSTVISRHAPPVGLSSPGALGALSFAPIEVSLTA